MNNTGKNEFLGENYHVIAIYCVTKVADEKDRENYRYKLETLAKEYSLIGHLIVAPEGLNGTIAAGEKNEIFLEAIDKIKNLGPHFLPGNFEIKYSTSNSRPFNRMRVLLRKALLPLGESVDVDLRGRYVDSVKEWDKLILDNDVVKIDVRNDYEISVGSFKNAINPKMNSFKDFTTFIQNKFKNEIVNKETKIAMYCTGGIRCEIASAYMNHQGYKNCHMLHGGIIKYLENADVSNEDCKNIEELEGNQINNEFNPGANSDISCKHKNKSKVSGTTFQGECYVFDKRVSLGFGLQQGTFKICFRCRTPLSMKDQLDSKYIDGVCCGYCIESSNYKNLQATAERNKQIALSEERGEKHLRRDFFDNVT